MEFTEEHRKILAEARVIRPECVLQANVNPSNQKMVAIRRSVGFPWFTDGSQRIGIAREKFLAGEGGQHEDSPHLKIGSLVGALGAGCVLGLDDPATTWVDDIAKANGIEVTWRKPQRDDHLTPCIGETWEMIRGCEYTSITIIEILDGFYRFDTGRGYTDGYVRGALARRLRAAGVSAEAPKPKTFIPEFKITISLSDSKRDWDSARLILPTGSDPYELERRIAAAQLQIDSERKAIRTGPLKNRDRFGQFVGGGWETDCEEP